jgi:ribosomal protein S18 acetylase RimI-like enzyme
MAASLNGGEEIEIKLAGEHDLRAIQAIGRDTYIEHFASIWSAQGLDEFLARDFSGQALQASLSSPLHAWLIVRDAAGAVAGYAKLNWNRREAISGAIGAELQKIYFRRSATGHGFGSKTLQSVLTLAREQRQSAIWLNVLSSNESGRRFYLRQGFNEIGETQFSTDVVTLAMTAMVRRLVI